MKSTIRKVVRLSTMFSFTTLVLVGALAYGAASIAGYDVASLPPPHADRAYPSSSYETVSFSSRGQRYPVYAFFLVGKAGYPALIIVPGYKGSRYNSDQIARADAFQKLGYSVLSIDLAGGGGDTVGNGRIGMGFHEKWDVLGAFDYLVTRGFTPDQIGLAGVSMGASTVLLAGAAEPRIKAIWADSGYSRADAILTEQAAASGIPTAIVPSGLLIGMFISGDRIWEAAPIEAGPDMAAHGQAIYLVHCEQDAVVPLHHGVDLNAAFKAAGVNVTYWQVPECGHMGAMGVQQDAYLARFDAFFQAHLVVHASHL